MATVALQHIIKEQSVVRSFTGAMTGNLYITDQLGRAVVDVLDAPRLLAGGTFAPANLSDSGTAGSGTAVLDFGAFPGKPVAETTVTASNPFNSTAVLQVAVAPIATTDHSADEHSVDPPLVSGIILSGTQVLLRAMASGRDKPVPPGAPFGQANTSQMPVPRRQCNPYGKWSVSWAFVP
jgi:hypothetical protein